MNSIYGSAEVQAGAGLVALEVLRSVPCIAARRSRKSSE